MFLSRMIRFQMPTLATLAVAAAALLLAAGPAPAQPPGSSKLWPWNVRGASQAPAVARTTPSSAVRQSSSSQRATAVHSLNVVVTIPAGALSPEFVTLQGPDGKVRTFPLEGGREAIVVREVTLGPGERLTINLTPSATPRK
jgi:hypothetical protein